MKRRKFFEITLPLAFSGRVMGREFSPEEKLSFGVIADPQYADAKPAGTRFYRESLGKLEKAIKDFNGQELSFVVTLGDLIDQDIKSFDAVMPIYEKLRHVHYPICGNHDFSVADADKAKVLEKMKLSKAYYSKVVGNWRFVFLDGTEMGIYRYPAKDERTAVAKAMLAELIKNKSRLAAPSNAAISPEQLKWLKNELDAAQAVDQRVVIFNHYPVIPANNGHNLWNAPELVALFDGYDHIAAYMNGHNHAGNYGNHKGCHYLNFKGMVETKAETAYSIVRCFSDRLEIEGYGLESDRELKKPN